MPATQTQNTLKHNLPDLIFYSLMYTTILALFIALFNPFLPDMVSVGLDESWEFALNQALAQHLEFGKDIIFTYGPYSYLTTRIYHPATDGIRFILSLYIAISYFVCFLIISKGTRPLWILIFCIGLGCGTTLLESVFLIYPLLLGLAVFKIISSEEDALYKRKWYVFLIVFLFFPLGLLALIKGTMLIMSALVATLCFIFLIINKKAYLAIAGFLSLIISTLFFWWLAGQPISNLLDFFMNMFPIISGYSEAMQSGGDLIDVIIYIIPATFLLLFILWEMKADTASDLFLFFLYLFFLFFAFKLSFVLQNNHALIASAALITGALLFPFIFQPRVTLFPICFSVVCSAYLSLHYLDGDAWQVKVARPGISESLNHSVWLGLVYRLQDQSWPQHDFESTINSIKEQVPFPRLEGTTDIYSWNQAALIASGNTWSPRPIIQSYSAYTKSLALKNREHLLENKAPDNIIFRIETLRDNLPSIEDGASWPVLLSYYQPVQMENGYLFLRKRETFVEPEKTIKYESKIESFGKNVDVPNSNQFTYATLEIHPTFLGWLANLVFKSTPLKITLTLNNGGIKAYRMVSGVAKAGFLISPLVKDTKDFSELYEKTNIDKDRVKYFSIEGDNMLWNDKYTVTFSENDI